MPRSSTARCTLYPMLHCICPLEFFLPVSEHLLQSRNAESWVILHLLTTCRQIADRRGNIWPETNVMWFTIRKRVGMSNGTALKGSLRGCGLQSLFAPVIECSCRIFCGNPFAVSCRAFSVNTSCLFEAVYCSFCLFLCGLQSQS